MRCLYTVDAGVYVLGALSPADRAGYERHLASCVACRAEVAELAGLPGLLGRLDPDVASSIAADTGVPLAPVGLLDTVLRRARREHSRRVRRRRWQFAGAALAAACLAALVGFGVSIVDGRTAVSGTPVVAQMSPVGAAGTDTPVSALVGYVAAGDGTDIRMLCSYREASSPDGDPWRVSLVVYPRGGGRPMTVATWPVRPGTDVKPFTKHIAMKPADIGRIELDRDDGTKLLFYEPA